MSTSGRHIWGHEPVIKETHMTSIDAEVVVVGFGISGLTAALSALDAGAGVVVLEKGAKNNARGFDCGSVNSSVHKEAGVTIDREELIAELMVQSNYRADQRLISVWVDKSGETIDWLRGLMEPRGVEASLPEHGAEKEGPYRVWQTAVNWTGQNVQLAKEMEALIVEKGGDIHYNTPAVRLVREGEGRVTAVIAEQPDGSLLRVNAKKGVILSCGGYDDNPEMMEKYLRPSDLRFARHNSETGGCVGDGHTMALALGAAMDEKPHCLILGNGIIQDKNHTELYLVMFTPYLRVDCNAERFVNEDSDYCRAANANARLPKAFHWSIIDSTKEEGRWGEKTTLLDQYVPDGAVLKADTLEELAKKMDVPAETLKASVERYNSLAAGGKDADFGVEAGKMKPVEVAPYYAVKVLNFCLVTVSGLTINTNMQVMDTEAKAIPGLYASGNTSGGFFADAYPRNVHGASHGRAMTFGRLAALHAASQKG
jgi:fumarate reductase flavoprotein subunit